MPLVYATCGLASYVAAAEAGENLVNCVHDNYSKLEHRCALFHFVSARLEVLISARLEFLKTDKVARFNGFRMISRNQLGLALAYKDLY